MIKETGLTTLETVTTIGQTLASTVATVKNFGANSKKASVALAEDLHAIKYHMRGQGIHSLMEMRHEDIDKSINKIQDANHTGIFRELDNESIVLEHQLLLKNIAAYANKD